MAAFTNSSTLILKIIDVKLNFCVTVVFWSIYYNVIVQIKSFLSFSNFKFQRPRTSFKALLVYVRR